MLVLHPDLRQRRNRPQNQLRQPQARLEEARGLAAAIGLEIVDSAIVGLSRARPATLFGRGKVDEIASLVGALEAGLVVVDGQLSPIQQRNLERAWSCKVIDRSALILEIFGARARTREGRLQVELAALEYQRGRLVRSWTHLERQRGGFGFLGGPGETQIEADRRQIAGRLAKIRRELEAVRRTRQLHRASRQKVPFAVAALVGYTNAGKSTLFNRLTEARVEVADQLFATLDPTMRGITLPGGRRLILSDTVGFISQLPTMLVAAFRATLEEVLEADLIVHVRDVAHPDAEQLQPRVAPRPANPLAVRQIAASQLPRAARDAGPDLVPPGPVRPRVSAPIDKPQPLCYSGPRGRIAQLAEQLTLNQRVQGSNPCAPTS